MNLQWIIEDAYYQHFTAFCCAKVINDCIGDNSGALIDAIASPNNWNSADLELHSFGKDVMRIVIEMNSLQAECSTSLLKKCPCVLIYRASVLKVFEFDFEQ